MTVSLSDPVLHLLRRATFGPTPALVAEVRRLGATTWLSRQLSPASIPDPEVETILARYPRQRLVEWQMRDQVPADQRWDTLVQTADLHLARAVWSRRQLLEVMADFWSNHLNVTCPAEGWDTRHRYAAVIRRHALGRFADLLVASAKSPAMLTYLDNAESDKRAPNENYGRELLELHTVGLGGGYREADVRTSALLLTGLSVDVESGNYLYKPIRRYVGPLKIMGFSTPNDSATKGEAVAVAYLTYLARHPSTAKRLATKLAVRFVADKPPATLVARLAQVYRDNDTAIAPVLRALFTSAEFKSSAGKKIRTPLEDAVATLRILDVRPPRTTLTAGNYRTGLRQLYYAVAELGQRPLGWHAPNGYPDTAAAWASSTSTLERWNFHVSQVAGWWPPALTRHEPSYFLPATLPSTYDGLVRAISARLLVPDLSSSQRAAICTFLDHRPDDPLKGADAAVTWRLPYVIGLVLDSPQFARR